MNDHDKANLDFLLNSSPETVRDWYAKMDKSDHTYAEELLRRAKVDLDMYVAAHFDTVEDLSLANAVLKQFRR
jgi:hypothetical protein